MRAGVLVPILLLLATPLSPAAAIPQDDAGSGRDAPATPTGAVRIEPGVLYHGFGDPVTDLYDVYALRAEAGQRIEARVDGGLGCYDLLSPGGTEVGSECAYANAPLGQPLVHLAAETGDYALRVANLAATTYRFGYGLDAPAPATALLPPLPVPQDDAGSGRDAPDAPSPDVRIEEVRWYQGTTAGRDVDHYAFQAEAGQRVAVTLAPDPSCSLTVVSARGEPVPTTCMVDLASNFVSHQATIPASGTWLLRVEGARSAAYRVAYVLDAPALGPFEVEGRASLPAGPDPTCGTGAPVTATGGGGPGGLVFAALKTGTRAIVAWSTDAPVAAALAWNVSGAPTATLVEPTPRTQHVFVLDGLPRGASLCFTAGNGVPRALRLANAMHAHDGDAYVLNLLVLANEQPDRQELEEGLDGFAWRLRDATDGHVKAGRVVVLYGDLEHHNSGWTSCYATVAAVGGHTPTCRLLADVIFTADALPAGAASTYPDGIRNPKAAIWMNSYWQAGAVNLGDNEGFVLMHEVGHYAFGAMDLYGSVAGTDPDCWAPAKSLSVMGGNRAATEFDDEVNRCPNEASLFRYVPTWTLLRERYPLVPDRAGVIEAGPTTPGDAYHRSAFVVLPVVPEHVPDVPQDDAGSGRDAPGHPEPSFVVQPGTWYEADVDPRGDADHYAFTASGPATVNLTVDTTVFCPGSVVDASGVALAATCTLDLVDGTARVSARLPAEGTWFLRLDPRVPYRFAFALDAPHPEARPLPR